MTVAELIEKLQALPQELPVYFDMDYTICGAREVTVQESSPCKDVGRHVFIS